MGHSKEQMLPGNRDPGDLILSILPSSHRFIIEKFQTLVESTERKLKVTHKSSTFLFIFSV